MRPRTPLIGAAAKEPAYQSIVDDVLKQARKNAGSNASDKDVAAYAFKTLAVAFGRKILEIIPGRVSTEVDARISYDTEKSIATARDIIAQYESAGISRERILIKLASTWELPSWRNGGRISVSMRVSAAFRKRTSSGLCVGPAETMRAASCRASGADPQGSATNGTRASRRARGVRR